MSTYRLEVELQETIIDQLPALRPAERALYYRREVPLGGRIPDIVCVIVEDGSGEAALPKTCNYRHAAVLCILKRRQRVRLPYMAEQLYTNVERLKPVLSDLVQSGAIVENATGSYSLSELWRSTEAEVIAVEAKLKRWKDALAQAISYMRSVDRVVVAMDAITTPRSEEVLLKFKDVGVGLCAISPNSTEWLVRPRRTDRPGYEREYLLISALTPSQTLWSRL